MQDPKSIPTLTDDNNPMAAKSGSTIAYTDGACKGNPGAGGWGAHLILGDGRTQDVYGGEDHTTNNRMELMGAIKALEYSPDDMPIEIWTDSSYVKKGITEWITGWKKRGWINSSKKPVANKDLWQRLDSECQNRAIEWHWVKGHAGHAGNEKADELANLGVTSSSETDMSPQADATNTDDLSKKKASIIADDDWLTCDPLGLDGFDYELNNDSIDNNLDSDLDDPDDNIEHNAADNQSKPTTIDTIHSPPTSTSLMTTDDADAIDLPEFDGDTSRANPNFVPLLPVPTYRGAPDRQLIMDTETTGLDALRGDRIIEVGIVEMVGRKFTGEKLHVYINPERGMDEEVIRIHGISEAFLADKPTFDKVAQSLYDFMDGAEIIAHNASFDMTFLSTEFDKVGLTDFAKRVQVTDSLALAKQQYPGQKNTLDALVRRLDVGKQDRTFHGALLDSEILAEVYLAMTGGQVSLAIEEDSHADGSPSAHASFANLAALLLDSTSDTDAHKAWLGSLSADYPELDAKLSDWQSP